MLMTHSLKKPELYSDPTSFVVKWSYINVELQNCLETRRCSLYCLVLYRVPIDAGVVQTFYLRLLLRLVHLANVSTRTSSIVFFKGTYCQLIKLTGSLNYF